MVMTEIIQMQPPDLEETIVHLRRVILSLSGCALGQGLKKGQSPEGIVDEMLSVFPTIEPQV